MRKLFGWIALAAMVVEFQAGAAPAAEKAKVVVIAGRPSHGRGEHEFNAGGKLLVKCLGELPDVAPVFVPGGWPANESVFDGARTLVFFMDGGGGHPIIQADHLKTIGKLMDKGVGLVCLHYAVEIPKDKGGKEFLDWIGGYYETGLSDNPHNDARLVPKEGHPITRGVKPFRANDEWYFRMRFRTDDSRVTPILTAEELRGHDGKTYTDQIVAWAAERADGGRGFGFTGAHNHKNWGNNDFRRIVLNAILWSAKLDVPSGGVESTVSDEELARNLDPK